MAAQSVPPVTLDGRSLTSAAVSAVAREEAPVVLAADARARNAAAAEVVTALIARGTAVYGATTGVGPFRSRAVSAADRFDHQLRLLRSHAAGGGRPLSPSLVRAAMAVRANQFGAGGGGVSDELLGALIDALNAGVVPFARQLGSLGTGDITVLAEIALALLGEGRAWRGPELLPADVALADAGVAPARLGVRDGLAFMSSSAATIGHAALIAVDADRLLRGALTVAALSFLVAGADAVVLDHRVHAGRPHPGQVAVAARMRELLGAELARRDSGRGPVHDPYPFRALAQVDGAARDALSGLEFVLAVELNAANENALVDPDAAAVLPNANFHAAPLALALDHLRAALAQWSALVAARVSALLDPGLMGLPPALSPRPGPHSGALALEYTAHAAAADVRSLAAPVATLTTTVAGGIESHASFAPLAARRAQDALESAAVVVATELVVAFRALRMRGPIAVEGEVRELLAAATERLAPDLADRALGDDVEAARRLLVEERRTGSARAARRQPPGKLSERLG